MLQTVLSCERLIHKNKLRAIELCETNEKHLSDYDELLTIHDLQLFWDPARIYNPPSESEVKKTQRFLIWSILTLATIFDARSYTIPNQLIVLGYLAGLFTNLFSLGIHGIAHFIIMAIWPIGLLMLLYLCGKSIGAGDIKLFSVMATLVGVSATVKTFVLSVFLAGITIVAISIKEGQLLRRKLHYSYYMTAAFFCLQCI